MKFSVKKSVNFYSEMQIKILQVLYVQSLLTDNTMLIKIWFEM